MPGSGKTELALQAAHQALEGCRWFDGVLHVDLFGYDPQRQVDPVRALGGWLLNLGIDVQDIPVDIQGREQMFRAELRSRAERGRPILVIVDNASSVEQVQPLLPGDSSSGVLVTSRHVLDLGGRVHRLGELDDGDAVEVIRRSLWEIWGDADTRVVDQPDDALSLARLCGRLPLALRIVAGLLADVPTQALAQMADDLRQERLNGLEREERAVRAAFDLSYRNLASRQAELFGLVALAPGTDVSTESAAVLIQADETEAHRHLAALARASLIDAVGDRWRLHDLVRLYAGERAGGTGQDGAGVPALRRLLTHLMLTADAADDSVRALPGDKVLPRFAEEEAALAWLDGEQETLVAAVQVARELQETTCAVNLPLILATFMQSRMRLAELLEITELGCRTAEESGRRGDAAKLWATIGETLVLMRSFKQAAVAHDMAFAHSVAVEDWQSTAGALNSGGVALRYLGDFEGAINRHTEAVLMFDRIGDQIGVAKASNNKANVFLEMGRPGEAVIHQQVAIEIYAKRGDGRGFARSCLNMGNSYSSLGMHDLALASFQWACDYFRDGGDQRVLAMATAGLAVSLYRTGLSDEGKHAFEEAIRLFRELTDLYNEARTWRNFGVSLRDGRHFAEAEAAFRKGVDAFAKFGDPCGVGDCWNGISGILVNAGQYEDALSAARRAAECHEGLAPSECAAVSWNNLAFILSALGRVEEAIPVLRSSRAASIAQGNLRRAAQVSRTLGFKLVETDRFEAAVESFREAVGLFAEAGDAESAEQVAKLMAECVDLLEGAGE
jgi:tetratricopeptide (TPR) repeat protein